MEPSIFVKRINRFVVECEKDGILVQAHLPNPGRLWELLLPGQTVWLKSSSGRGKLSYTAMAVEKNSHPVMLHTQLTNDIITQLIKDKRIPGLEEYDVEKREITLGRSRIDFLLSYSGSSRSKGKNKIALEVKTCTLFRDFLALFPDAETLRGTRHITELTSFTSDILQGSILFVVQWPNAKFFMPDIHVDINFARTLLEARNVLDIRAISLSYKDLSFEVSTVRPLEIPWTFIEAHTVDSGCYILLITCNTPKIFSFRKSSPILSYLPGTYIYVGKAKKHLQKRMAYHLRRRKKLHWHIDRLTLNADHVRALPIRLPEAPECDIARALADRFPAIPGFGSSDCKCDSHLFYTPYEPVHDPNFVDILMDFRVGYLEDKLRRLCLS